jgi:hypothetical protein
MAKLGGLIIGVVAVGLLIALAIGVGNDVGSGAEVAKVAVGAGALLFLFMMVVGVISLFGGNRRGGGYDER